MDSRNVRATLDSAWLIICAGVTDIQYAGNRVVGVLDPQIPSSTMLQIVDSLYISHKLKPLEQILNIQSEEALSDGAGFVYLNDGSQFEGHIVCGRSPRLEAVRAFELTLYGDESGRGYLSWKQPSMIVYDGECTIDYWDELKLQITDQ